MALKLRAYFCSVAVLLLVAGLYLWDSASLIPPGLSSDEAFFLLQARSIAEGKAYPVYITGNGGIEPAFFYLVAGLLKILGVGWAVRLAVAFGGLLSVALVMRAGQTLFESAWVGLGAGCFLGTLYWHLNFSRYGVQYIWVVVAATGTVVWLWEGLKTQRLRAFALSGIFMGFGLQTYVAFRLFPVVAIVGTLIWLVRHWPDRWAVLKGWGLLSGVVGVVYAPTALFFLRSPEWFYYRFRQTAEAVSGAGVWDNARKVLLGLMVQGDLDWRHNLIGRPALDVVQGYLFVLGAIYLIRRWRKAELWLVGAWLGIGLLPSILTENAPHFGRAIMATPAIALLLSLGLWVLWEVHQAREWRWLVVAAVALSACLTNYDYFVRWRAAPEQLAHAKDTLLAEALLAAPSEAWLYTTPMHQEYYYDNFWALEFLLGEERYAQLRTFNGTACQILPLASSVPAQYAVFLPDDAQTMAFLQQAFPQGQVALPQLPFDQNYVIAFSVAGQQTPTLPLKLASVFRFSDVIELAGYTIAASSLQASGSLQLTLAWQAIQENSIAYKVFIHVLGPAKDNGEIVYAQYDNGPCANSYPTTQWRPHELIYETYAIPLPATLPRGTYVVQVGWYGPDGQRLPVINEFDHSVGDAAPLLTVSLP